MRSTVSRQRRDVSRMFALSTDVTRARGVTAADAISKREPGDPLDLLHGIDAGVVRDAVAAAAVAEVDAARSAPARRSGRRRAPARRRSGLAPEQRGLGRTGRRLANRPRPLRSPSRPCSGRGASGSVVSHFGPPTAPSSTASAAAAPLEHLRQQRHAVLVDRDAPDRELGDLEARRRTRSATASSRSSARRHHLRSDAVAGQRDDLTSLPPSCSGAGGLRGRRRRLLPAPARPGRRGRSGRRGPARSCVMSSATSASGRRTTSRASPTRFESESTPLAASWRRAELRHVDVTSASRSLTSLSQAPATCRGSWRRCCCCRCCRCSSATISAITARIAPRAPRPQREVAPEADAVAAPPAEGPPDGTPRARRHDVGRRGGARRLAADGAVGLVGSRRLDRSCRAPSGA